MWLGDRMIVSYCEGDMVVEHFERKITFAIVLSHVCEFYWRAPYIECAEPGCFAEFVFSATRPDPVRCRAHDGIDERG